MRDRLEAAHLYFDRFRSLDDLFACAREAPAGSANRLDAQPGGPGGFFKEVAERFRPEAFYVCADRRAAYWVVELADGAAMAEMMHFLLARAGAHATFTPVLSGDEARTAVPAAIQKARG